MLRRVVWTARVDPDYHCLLTGFVVVYQVIERMMAGVRLSYHLLPAASNQRTVSVYGRHTYAVDDILNSLPIIFTQLCTQFGEKSDEGMV